MKGSNMPSNNTRRFNGKRDAFYKEMSDNFLPPAMKAAKLKKKYEAFISRPGVQEAVRRSEDDLSAGRVCNWDDVKRNVQRNLERRCKE